MQFTAEMLAALIGGTVDGDPKAAVSTFAKIEEGHPGALSFLANPKYTHYIYDTQSSIVLVADTFVPERPVQATMIRVADPYGAVTKLMEMAAAAMTHHPVGIEQPSYIAEDVAIDKETYVGAFAYIGKGAVIGRGAKIYPQVYVGNGAVIGEDTVLYPGSRVYPGCHIGARCIIHAGVVIGADGFGFAPDSEGVYHKIPQMGIVEIGDDVEIGANTTVDRATMGATHVGRGTKLDNLIQVAHNVTIGEHTVVAAQAGIAGSAHVGSHCMVGGQAGIAGHIAVGDRTQIGAQSGVPNNVAPGSRIMGYPAVPAGEFARQAAYIRRLGQLFDRVGALEKSAKQQ